MDVRVLTYEDTERLLPPADCVAAIQSVYAQPTAGLIHHSDQGFQYSTN